MQQKVREGNSHNDFVADVVHDCEEEDMGYFVENPDTSWWWFRHRRWRKRRPSDSGRLFRLCFCRFGTAWSKAARIATNTRLSGVRMMCTAEDSIRDFEELILQRLQSESHGRLWQWHSLTHLGLSKNPGLRSRVPLLRHVDLSEVHLVSTWLWKLNNCGLL